MRFKRQCARIRDESGLTLIEVMITASILAVILGAIYSLSEATSAHAPRDDERGQVIQESRTALYAATRELRQATAVTASSGYSFRVSIGARDITYACDVDHPTIAGQSRCTRREGTGPVTVVVDHLTNEATGTPVFVRAAGSNYAEIRFQVAAAGERREGHEHRITLHDGFYMRNLP